MRLSSPCGRQSVAPDATKTRKRARRLPIPTSSTSPRRCWYVQITAVGEDSFENVDGAGDNEDGDDE